MLRRSDTIQQFALLPHVNAILYCSPHLQLISGKWVLMKVVCRENVLQLVDAAKVIAPIMDTAGAVSTNISNQIEPSSTDLITIFPPISLSRIVREKILSKIIAAALCRHGSIRTS